MTNSDFLKRFSELPPKRQALLALDLQNRLNASEQQRHEPIAVIAMGCRFPGGVNTPEAYWELLMNGVDAISEVPPERWDADANYDPNPDAPGKIATRWGGFLKDVDQFDPQLFGISPREAITMDPQQRLLLEVCWETFERAGYAPDQLNGKRGGVFVGLCNGDYYHMVTADGSDQVDMYLATGSAHSVASGRISYLFGLQGPAISIDTACSSSLVAIHMAVRSLRDGECDFALAGGVNLVLSLDTTRALSRAGMMASDGRCKAFDSRADGFVRSEGCGMVMLKPLSKALADHDPIIAVVQGSAVNQDGRSNGLTAPNGPSQENVICSALADARLNPADVDYVETHGTGTSLGDPIEVQALGAAYGSGRINPLLIGSVKTNMGHMESAAGVAGFMKLALVLQHKYVPPHLHLDELNPYIPWDQLPVTVPTDGVALPEQDGKSVGAISSFGFSGTNAHVIMSSWSDDESPAAPAAERPAHILPLSAHNEVALQEIAALWEARLAADPDMLLADAAHTAGVGRAQLPYRLALVAADANEARAKLAAFRAGEKADGLIVAPERGTRRRKIAFLFSGQGSQTVQMGRQLYETQPVFRDTINRCDELLRLHLDISLLSILYPDDSQSSPIQEIAYAQPAQFAIEYALATLWQSWGIEPGAVAGHSIGEYAAACIAGIFSLEDALKMVAARGRLMQTTAPGEMAAVFADETTVQSALVAYAGKVSIAALNAPEITVISGEKDALASVINDLKGNRIRAKRLEVSIAAHSPQMDNILKPFSEIAAQVQYHTPELDFYSALTGNLVQASEIARPEYWIRHLREPVRFAPVMQNLYAGGYHCFIENGPAPDLLNMAQRTLPEDNGIIYLPSLRPGTDDWQQILNSLGFLYVNGVNVDWQRFDQTYQRRRLILPTYPFQRQRYWFKQNTNPALHRTAKGDHPLLGERLRSPGLTDIVFQTELSANWPSFLDHHRIYGVVILPSPAYIEMVLTAAHKALDSSATYSVKGFSIHEALVLSEENLRLIQVILSRDGVDANFQVLALNDDGETWKLHASGSLVTDSEVPDDIPLFHPAEIQARCSEMIDGAAYYERIRTLGLEFGSSFQGVSKVWRRDGEALGQISLPSALTAEFGQYLFHPALLDSCFHLLGAPLSEDLETGYLLIAIDSFRLYSRPGPRLWNHTVLTDVTGETFTGEIRLYNEDGSLVAEATGLHLKRAGRDALMRAVHRRPDDWFYQVAWEPRPSLALAAGITNPEFASPGDIAAHVDETAQTWTLPADFGTYADVAAALEDVSAAFIVAALRENGVDFYNGRLLKPDDLTGEQDYYRQRLMPNLMNYLVNQSILAVEDGGWRVINDTTNLPVGVLTELVHRYPSYQSEIELLERCGSALAQVLQGDIDPLSLLFPEGSFEELERIYGGSPVAQVYNKLLRQTVSEALKSHTADRPLRILEIGAGTGATTASLLSLLVDQSVHYTFTDISPLFLERARAKFSEFPNMSYEYFNIEENPLEQGFVRSSYDVVIAANVFHATRDLRQTLTHVHHLLAPGGLVVMLEGTQPQAWVDMTFGLTEGWWRFSDQDLRPHYPLIDQTMWLQLLGEMGFAASAPLCFNDTSGQIVIVGQKSLTDAEIVLNPKVEWLIFADGSDIGTQLVDQFAFQGRRAALVMRDSLNSKDDSQDVFHLNDLQPSTLAQLLQQPSLESLKGIIYLGGWGCVANQNIAQAAEADTTALLTVLQSLNQRNITPVPAIWVITIGAQPVDGKVTDPAMAALWGFGRVLALENPQRWGGLIDLDPAAPDAAHVIQEIVSSDGEDQVAYRSGERHVARLIHTRATQPEVMQFDPDASYLITGGLGGLGLNIAAWMAEHGARHLTLLSRSKMPDRTSWNTLPASSDVQRRSEGILALEALGVEVNTHAANVGDYDQMADLFAHFGGDLPPLKGIIHAAAALSNAPIADMPVELVASQFDAKVSGAIVLDQLAHDIELDFFVAFSSTTALWGVRELGHYAAANTFLDAFVYDQRARGVPAFSINWGTWEEMRIASVEERAAVAQYGLKPMPSDQALGILGDILARASIIQMTVASVDWNLLKPAYEARRRHPLLEYMGNDPIQESLKGASAQVPSLTSLETALPEERLSIILEQVAGSAAAVLGVSRPDMLDVYQGLFDMGMDSLMSVELKTRLEKSIGRSLPSTLTFNYPTIAELAEYLLSTLFPVAAAVQSIPEVQDEENAPTSIDEMDDFSEDELADLLMKKLRGLQ